MAGINSNRLDEILWATAELLGAAEAEAHLVVIGGSGLMAIGVVTRPTRDVDVVALKRGDELVSATPLPEAVTAAAAIVARDFDLEPGWLNPGPTGLLDLGLPREFQQRLITRSYGTALMVSFAARVDQVFFKLYAAADRREPRDISDLRALRPTPEELREAARWARTHNAPGPFDVALAQTLNDFGVEDEGRDDL